MPAQLMIKWPKHGRTVNTGPQGVFAAFGHSNMEVKNLVGTCTPLNGLSQPVEGLAIFPNSGSTDKKRWLLAFRVPASGDYSITISSQGTSPATLPDIHVTVGGTPTASHHHTATISWPDRGDDITAYKDDFCPYGPLTEYPLGDVSLTEASTSNTVAVESSYGDPVELQFWTVQFAPVPASSSTYTLDVADTQGNGDEKTGLKVTS